MVAVLPLGATEPVEKVNILAVKPELGRVEAELLPEAKPFPKDGRLLLTVDLRPVGWFDFREQAGTRGVFERAGWPAGAPTAGTMRAWLVAPDATAKWLDRWPPGAALQAEIDRLGPGGSTAWLFAGAKQGVRVGDRWWLRIKGQPVARMDVNLVEPDLCFCTVIPLVADWRLTREHRMALWPTPRQQTRGEARSAVSYVEALGAPPPPEDGQKNAEGGKAIPEDDDKSAESRPAESADPGAPPRAAAPPRPLTPRMVWLPAPRPVACPSETRVDFYREGRYVGHGIVEKRDPLFWYVRTLPAACAEELRVGDDAVVRTQADVDAKRFVARVYELTPEGSVVNASEADGLTAGQTGTAWRDGRPLGEIVVHKPQAGYALVRPAETSPGLALRVLDEIRFAPPPAPPVVLGAVERVADETLFTAKLAPRAAPPLLTPLALRAGTRTVGVAVLLAAEGDRAVGFAIAPALTQPLAAGWELVRPE